MTRQTWSAVTAAVVFVLTAALIAFVPIPFVAWVPGDSHDLLGSGADGRQVIQVDGLATYPTPGQLRLTTVSQTRADSSLSLPEALIDYLLPHRDVLPRETVYEAGKPPTQVEQEEKKLMTSAQSDAVVAALREAGQPVAEFPRVTAVRTAGPSNGKLEPGDVVLTVDNEPVSMPAEVADRVRRKAVGEKVVIGFRRDGRADTVTIDLAPSVNDGRVPTVGVSLDVGYSYNAEVSYAIDPAIGGSSGGLVFAVAIYDRITPSPLIDGRSVAGTGTINARGEVGVIGGVQQKIAGAEAAGADIFLVPAGNCADVAGIATSVRLVKVATLSEAVAALRDLKDPAREPAVPQC
ncbi:MAG: PDZ domain-containing protein [Actinomycetia bacterium]|nr:PDZ domain-containing protein [Actinomycetes bacterium]